MAKPVTPLLTVDVIVELMDSNEKHIVLIERKHPPFGWALPGGFVDIGETLATAAVREAKEEISLDVKLTALLGCYSNPQRDSRGHTVSAVFIASAEGTPVAADDAANVAIFKLQELPNQLAFDHRTILEDYQHFCNTGEVAPLNR